MNADTIIQQIEALFSANIKMADRHNLETIQVTTPRAKTIMQDILFYKNEKSKANSKHIKKEPAWLDEKWI
jgi:hypothetical protein